MSDSPVTQFLLEKRRVSVNTMVSRLAMLEATIDIPDFTTNDLRITLETDIWSHHLEKQTQRDVQWVPATWWQHLKLTLIKRGIPFIKPENVRMTCITFTTHYDVFATYPELNFVTPKSMRVMFLDFDAFNEMEETDESRTDHKE